MSTPERNFIESGIYNSEQAIQIYDEWRNAATGNDQFLQWIDTQINNARSYPPDTLFRWEETQNEGFKLVAM